MKLKNVCFIIAFLTAGMSTLSAQQDTVFLTLEDALNLARTRSADAMIAKNNFRMNYWQYRSFKAEYLPWLTLDASLPTFSRAYESVRLDDGSKTYQYNTFNYYSAQMTLNQEVGPTGGSVFLKSGLERTDNIYDDSTFSSYQSTPVVIGYNQPIFQFNEYRWAKQLEPIKYEKAKRKYLEDLEEVSKQAVNHFFNLLIAQVEQVIALKNLNNYDTLYRVGKGRYQLGKLAENDLLQFELRFLEAKAKVDRANLNYEVMLNRLKIYLGLKDKTTIRLLPPAETWHGEVSAANALAEAKKNTSTFLDFNERMITAESQVRKAKMDGRFDADLYMQFGLTQSNPDLSDVYKNPLDQQSVNLGVQVPLLDWGNAKGKIKMAESNYELVQTYVEQQYLDAEQTVLLNVMEFNMQKDQLYIAAKADTIAQKRYEVTQKRYMIGQINDAQELNYAQIDNDNAKQNYYSSLQSYWNNYFELRKLTLYDFIGNKMLIFDIRDVL